MIKKNYLFLITLLIVSLSIFTYIQGNPFLEFMELKTVDLRFISGGQKKADSNIVLAVIDEKSIAKEGKWIWPRWKIARLVRNLSDAGAKLIVFDIGFLEQDETDHKMLHAAQYIQEKIKGIGVTDKNFDAYLENLKESSDNDKLLAQAIAKSEAKVVLGYFFQIDKIESFHTESKDIDEQQKNIISSSYKQVKSSVPLDKLSLYEAAAPQSNIAQIAEQTPYSGYYNMFPDLDGEVRWIPTAIRFKDALYAPLSLMAASVMMNAPLYISTNDYGISSLKIGNIPIPTDDMGRFQINYRGRQKIFPHISVTDILNQQVSPEKLKGKTVIVGATAIGIYDMRVTPFDKVFPGVEIHANVIDNIVNKDFLCRPDWMMFADIMIMLMFGLVMGITLPKLEALWGFGLSFSLFTGYILICQYVFSKGYILNMVYPLTVILLIYISVTLYRYFTESKQKKFIKEAFSYYLAPSVVKQLIDSPEKLVLGGQERHITAFFSDVEGFTSISEKLQARQLVELLNEFLTEMTDIILKYEGTVDKFEGDAIIAFFGAPNDLKNHAETACMACVDMQQRLVFLREKWKAENRPELKMRLALYSGMAVVGNMGSKNRMDYTMMGDTVNTAARLEGVNKIYGTYTLIGETVYEALSKDKFFVREADVIYVVGKRKPIKIYQLIGYLENADSLMRDTVSLYEKGLLLYQKNNWDEAAACFEAALSLTPDDGPSKTMLSRCKEYKLNPPPDWNGVFSLKSKD